MREKITEQRKTTKVEYEEGVLKSIHKNNATYTSFRVYKDGKAGIYYQRGEVDPEYGFRRAEENLMRNREYPFEAETGVRTLDKREKVISDTELIELARQCMAYLQENYPDFTIHSYFYGEEYESHRENEAGMDYRFMDSSTTATISFKHKDSKDISDGSFGVTLRAFDMDKFKTTADNYLKNFNVMVDFPEELIIDETYYGVTGIFWDLLNGENLALGTSLLTGKVGQKVFSENFTLNHDLTDQECWFGGFWDGDGCVIEGGILPLVENGVVLTGYADKKTAAKYNIPHTKTANGSLADLPSAGGLNLRIKRSEKTVKELLNGRMAIIPVMSYGGGFNEKGEYTMPVHSSLLYDGEKILGKLPPFTMVSNLFDMFGEDFIGVGADNPIYNDKQILFRVKRLEL